jgi:signal transduction histidine kinase
VGLYLVSRLMERMRGYAVFCSSPGDGFRAELWLRAAVAE